MVIAKPSPAPVPAANPLNTIAEPMAAGSVETSQILAWLDEVPDPEIPVLSLIDLGVIRNLAWVDDTLEVTVTPTYSGCPATRVIETMIIDALIARGIPAVTIKTRLSPAWTTDWMTEKAKVALEKYGIAPPHAAASHTSGGPKRCPHCSSIELEMISPFGSTPCKAQWRCRNCLEPFDYFKCL